MRRGGESGGEREPGGAVSGGRRLPPGLLPAGVLLGAGLVRLGFFIATADDPYLAFRQGDEAYYHRWALQILDGRWDWGRSFFTTPLYAYALALAYRIGGQGLAYLRALNLALGIGAVWFTYLAARNALGRRPAVAAALLLGFCTAPVFYEWFPEKTPLVLLLTAAALWLVSRALRGGRHVPWVLAGIAAGLASLAHSLLLILLPAVGLHLLLDRSRPRPAALRALVVFAAGFLLGVLPATAHNFLQDGDFVLIGSHGGVTFFLGNHAGNRTGRYASPPFAESNADSEELDFKREAERRTGRALSAAVVSRYWFRQGATDIRADPGFALRRFWRRLRWALGSGEETDTRTFAFYQSRYRFLGPPLWGFGLVSLLGLAGIALTARRRELIVFAAFVLFFAAGTSLILVYGRYRLPLLVPLSLLAAAGLDRLRELVRGRHTGALLLAGLALGAAGWFVYAPVLPNDPVSFFVDFNNQGNRYLDQRRHDLAFAEYEKALDVNPGNHGSVPRLRQGLAELYRGLADHMVSQGRLAEAEALLRHALERYPGDPRFTARLAATLRRADRPPP